jgi:hypothetical protein
MDSDDNNCSETEWEVEKICQHDEELDLFLIKWKGWLERTWEPRGNLTNCDRMLRTFEVGQFIKKYCSLEAEGGSGSDSDDEEESEAEVESEEDEVEIVYIDD